jgi:hypothetical protein
MAPPASATAASCNYIGGTANISMYACIDANYTVADHAYGYIDAYSLDNSATISVSVVTQSCVGNPMTCSNVSGTYRSSSAWNLHAFHNYFYAGSTTEVIYHLYKGCATFVFLNGVNGGGCSDMVA